MADTQNSTNRSLADAYARSVNNYVRAAGSLKKKTASELLTRAAEVYQFILNGTDGDLVPGVYNPNDGYSLATSIYFDLKDTNNLNNSSSGNSSSSTLSYIPNSNTKYYSFSLMDGWNTNPDAWGVNNNSSIENKIAIMANHFKTRINKLREAKNENRVIKGLNGDVDSILANAGILDTIIDKVSSGKTLSRDENRNLIKQLGIIGKSLDGSSDGAFGTYFSDYFGNYLLDTTSESNKKRYEGEGYSFSPVDVSSNPYLQQFLNNGKYVLATKDGNNYLFNNDYSLSTNPITNINYDFTSSDYNQGVLVDANGRIWSGNVADVTAFPQNDLNSFYKQYRDYVTALTLQRSKDLFNLPQENNYYDYLTGYSKSNFINKIADLVKTKFQFLDVSRLFDTNTPIVAVSKGKKPFKQDAYGSVKLNDPDLEFYYEDSNGNVTKTTFDGLLKKGFNFMLNGDSYGTNIDSNIISLTANRDDLRQATDAFDITNNYANDGDTWHWFGNGDVSKGDTEIINNKPYFINNVMLALTRYRKSIATNEDSILLNNLGLSVNFTGFVKNINSLVLNDPALQQIILSNPEYRDTYRYLLRKNTELQKQGGVLKAAGGSLLDINGNPVNSFSLNLLAFNEFITNLETDSDKMAGLDAKDAGHKAAGERVVVDDLKALDFVRFGAMAADVVGMIAPYCGPHGMAVSGIAGVGSSLANLGADIADPAVSLGETLTGLGIGLSLDLIGVIPGIGMEAKGAKIIGKLAKYAPKLIALGMSGAVLLNPETYKSLEKINTSKKLTVDDWRNIAYALTAVAGLNRAGKGAFMTRKAKNKINTKVGDASVEVTGKNGEKVVISDKDGVAAAKKAIESNNIEELNSLVKKIPGNEAFEVKTAKESTGLIKKTEKNIIDSEAVKYNDETYALDFSKLDLKKYGDINDKWSNAYYIKRNLGARNTFVPHKALNEKFTRKFQIENDRKLLTFKDILAAEKAKVLENEQLNGIISNITPEQVTASEAALLQALSAFTQGVEAAKQAKRNAITESISRAKSFEAKEGEGYESFVAKFNKARENNKTKHIDAVTAKENLAKEKALIKKAEKIFKQEETLNQRLETLKADPKTNKTEIAKIKAKLGTLKTQIKGLREEAKSLGLKAHNNKALKQELTRDFRGEYKTKHEQAYKEYLKFLKELDTRELQAYAEELTRLLGEVTSTRQQARTLTYNELKKLAAQREAASRSSIFKNSATIKKDVPVKTSLGSSKIIKAGTPVSSLQAADDVTVNRFFTSNNIVELDKESAFASRFKVGDKPIRRLGLKYNLDGSYELFIAKQGLKLLRLINYINK